ncbi:MAG: right-handed parallel beta-helix repeat-containing protein, partial [Woeseiaceae bacterium]
FISSTTTDATPGPTLGNYSFTSLAAGTYFVVVDSQTMDAPSAGLHSAAFNTGVWAEQTYGGVGSYCADGAGGTTLTVAAGTCYGGRRGDVSDANTDAGTAEHVTRVVLSAVTTEVDMGLSFNVFVNTSVATAGSVNTTRSEQGSLDQAIRNSSNIIGPNALRFVPTVATNASGAGGSWWSIDYDNIGTEEEPHRIEDKDTILDGTAFDLADGITPRDTNTGFLGSNAGGSVTVGVSNSALPQVEKPELEIIGRLQLRSFAATRSPENAIIRDLAIWGNVSNALIDIAHSAALPAPNIVIENIVAGSRPDVFADAGGGSSRAIWTRAPVENGTVRNSLIGFQGSTPAMLQLDPGWVVEYNEFAGDRVGIYTSEGNLHVHHNLFNGVSGNIVGGPSPQPFEENTLSNSTGGALTLISDGHTVERNIFENGAGFGVGVSHDQGPPTPAHDNLITDNIFTNNGSVAIDLYDSVSGEDGVTPNDGTTTIGSGNQAMDYPVIDGATIISGDLVVTGFARAGATIEF